MKRGVYDHEKAVALWKYLMDSGAKKYKHEFGAPGAPWQAMFNVPTRLAAAREFADSERLKLEAKEYTFQNPARFRHRRLASPRLFRRSTFRTVTPPGRPDVRVIAAKRKGSGKIGVEIQARHSRWRLPMPRKAAYEFSRRWRGPGRAQVYERQPKKNPVSSGLVEIYPRVTRVEMQKGPKGARPVRNGRFYHDFKRGTRALGLPAGARITDARGRVLKALPKRGILLVNDG